MLSRTKIKKEFTRLGVDVLLTPGVSDGRQVLYIYGEKPSQSFSATGVHIDNEAYAYYLTIKGQLTNEGMVIK